MADCGFKDTVGKFPNALGIYGNRLVVGMSDYEAANIYVGEDRSQTDEVSLARFSVYPNPASGKIQINLSETDAIWRNSTATIFDVNGKEFFHERFISDGLNIGQLNPGIYFVTLSKRNGDRGVSKFIVVR